MAKKGKGKGFLGAVGSFFGSIPAVKSVKKAAKSVKKKVKKAKKKLKKVVKKAKKRLKKKIGKVFTKARKLKNKLSKSKLVKKVKRAAKKVVLAGKKAVKKAKKYTKAAVKKAKQYTKAAVKKTKNNTKATPKANHKKAGKAAASAASIVQKTKYINLEKSCPAPQKYSVNDGEPVTTLTDLRQVLSIPSTVTPDGLAPIALGANLAYSLLAEDLVTLADPNATPKEHFDAFISEVNLVGKAKKGKKAMETFNNLEKSLDAANKGNKAKDVQYTQKEIEQLGEYAKKLDKGTNITAGKKFKDHFIRHKSILEKTIGTKYPKYKTHGDEFLKDMGRIIDDGTVTFAGKGTIKKDNEVLNIYRGNGMTVVTKQNGEFVTLLESGKGMDIGIQFVP